MTTAMQEYDVVIVGAGFGGVYLTHRFKDAGYNVKCFEKAPKPAGVWHWNCYPGARVDSRYPIYQYSDTSIAAGWAWKEAFPAYDELRDYFAYVTKEWDLEGHIACNAEVTAAEFDEHQHQWIITYSNGQLCRTRWFISCLGFASKPYSPYEIEPTISQFQGQAFHTARWPQTGVSLEGKRVAVVGTGASGVQVIQTIAEQVAHLTVYQRTPSVNLPMRQESLSKQYQDDFKASGEMEALQKKCKYTKHGGQNCQWTTLKWIDSSPEQRRAVFEAAWEKGGFHPMLSTYIETLVTEEVNTYAWRFWAEKCRERIKKEAHKDILAPLDPVHAFAGKRTPMEQTYYEAFNLPHVDLIDLRVSPIECITSKGIKSANEGEIHFDVIVFATGFDAHTGGLTSIDIKDVSGKSLKQRWADGVYTQFGLSTSGFPNTFFTYGPQAPTAFSNGPACVEMQGDYIFDLIEDMTASNITRVETTPAAEQAWRDSTIAIWNKFIIRNTAGWYTGANIPGKKPEPLNWFGGFPNYYAALCMSRESGYEGYLKQSKKDNQAATLEQKDSPQEDGASTYSMAKLGHAPRTAVTMTSP